MRSGHQGKMLMYKITPMVRKHHVQTKTSTEGGKIQSSGAMVHFRAVCLAIGEIGRTTCSR